MVECALKYDIYTFRRSVQTLNNNAEDNLDGDLLLAYLVSWVEWSLAEPFISQQVHKSISLEM